jgi:hypothetical protein
MAIYTYQDLIGPHDEGLSHFIRSAIDRHESSAMVRTAKVADLYDRQMNKTINEYVRVLYTLGGAEVEDYTASNSKITSNFFNSLNTQRVQYSLGNGVSFMDPDEEGEDATKEALGKYFDHDIAEAAYYALIHGVSFPFWNLDRLHPFRLTEFVPFWDEHTGELRAGIRYWRLEDSDRKRPLNVVLYREEGYSRWREDEGGDLRPLVGGEGDDFAPEEDLVAYKTTYAYTEADGVAEVIGEDSYGRLPIVPMYASRLQQSTLVGMRQAIDSFDLVRSGFANDMSDCAMIYWLVENYGGMTDSELARFRDRLKLTHIAPMDSSAGGKVTPFTQEIPYQARKEYLAEIRAGIYEDFGALDVHTVAAGATNDHIDAAYQPMDDRASDFEYCVGEAIHQILAVQDIDDSPRFRRKRISNQLEQVQMVMLEAPYLDQRTILSKLPNIDSAEVAAIMEAKEASDMDMMGIGAAAAEEPPIDGEE